MKKILSLTLATMLFLGIIGYLLQEPSLETYHAITVPTGMTENAKPPESTESVTAPNETEPTRSAEPTEVTEPTQATETTQPKKPKENTNKQENESKSTDPPSTQPVETHLPETNPPETTFPGTKTSEAQPPTEATEAPTELAGCQHDWKCIHHAEEGHWRAGIICDCGWIVYGDPDELVARWNAHSASYSGADSLLDHGGYGSADEWIVDMPAIDEWVCRHCGEAKP